MSTGCANAMCEGLKGCVQCTDALQPMCNKDIIQLMFFGKGLPIAAACLAH
jgi:hypothetical protein